MKLNTYFSIVLALLACSVSPCYALSHHLNESNENSEQDTDVSYFAPSPEELWEKLCDAIEDRGYLCPVEAEPFLQLIYQIYDENQDGELTREELNQLLKDMGMSGLERHFILNLIFSMKGITWTIEEFFSLLVLLCHDEDDPLEGFPLCDSLF